MLPSRSRQVLVSAARKTGERCVGTLLYWFHYWRRQRKTVKTKAQFSIGDLVQHKLFGYRGVIVDVDPKFMLSDAWYAAVARSRPPKDRPWYRVLVHDATHETYVAERNLEPDTSCEPVRHPMIGDCFNEFRDGRYFTTGRIN